MVTVYLKTSLKALTNFIDFFYKPSVPRTDRCKDDYKGDEISSGTYFFFNADSGEERFASLLFVFKKYKTKLADS